MNTTVIRNMMAAHLWTQEQLAQAAGLDRTTVNQMLKNGSCATATARKLAKAFDVPPARIIMIEDGCEL